VATDTGIHIWTIARAGPAGDSDRQDFIRASQMPEKKTLSRARADRKAGKAPSTQAGEFVREQIEHIRQGKHGARSAKQAIAIGLSEARRAGVDLPPPSRDKASAKTRKQAARDYERGHEHARKQPVSAKRSRATEKALGRESPQAASTAALSRQARSAAARRSPAERSAAAQRAARTRRLQARRTAGAES
jgi:hypothetical protein